MKEAAGEANMTVITIVLIAIVLGVGTVIVTSVMKNTKRSSCCTSLGGVYEQGLCRVSKGGALISGDSAYLFNKCLSE